MRRDPAAFLHDIYVAGTGILRFVRGRTFEEFLSDDMLRLAVEREFEIIGEALSAAVRARPEIADQIAEASRIVGFRNRIAHGYWEILSESVWLIIHENLPGLLDDVRALLPEDPDPDGVMGA